ncbi:hypothetical protein FNW25_09305 [Flavobacterium franklandianum]|uniref:Uncharacterized protein n=1 Tax=Flavobacterium franklandianum TaxID=2594430 RepID=A0A553CU64_9FLAO|nr:hypothetical protein [Flavobacterium franklandianum]TRX24048.1 hypothetical protein FNW17_02405 [Flavobacterium franklandianum]TRX25382.1 hypothetical protein FNW25_09305 [Flavobacterium franklandianum]
MKLKLIIIICLIALTSINAQKKIAGNYIYKTECMGLELDGSMTLKAWGNGRNRFDAVAQAKKNAVSDVIFQSILEGKQDCAKKPLITEVNAEEKYEAYFNKFFADGGEFNNFISLKDERIGQKIDRDRKKARESVTYGLLVRVLRSELKSKLIADGIIKQ